MRTTTCLLALTLAYLVPTPGHAEDASGARIAALLPPTPNAKVCYARVYDTAHLKKHPKQRVTEMVFSLRYITFEEDESGQPKEDANYHYWFTLAAKLRDKPDMAFANGTCGSYGGIGCGVDCDGGGVILEPRADGDLLVRLDREYSYVRMTAGCGEEEEEDGVFLEAGEDDKVFKLSKVPASTCDAVEAELDKRIEDLADPEE